MIFNKNGKDFDFTFNLEKAIEIEERTGFNVFEASSKITNERGFVSLVGLNNACEGILGYGLTYLIAEGFSIADLTKEDGVIAKVLEDGGFISAKQSSEPSQEPTESAEDFDSA